MGLRRTAVALMLVGVLSVAGCRSSTEQVVWTYTSRAGIKFRIVDDDRVDFRGGRPASIYVIDALAVDPGPCRGLSGLHEYWLRRVRAGDEDGRHQSQAAAYLAYMDDILSKAKCARPS